MKKIDHTNRLYTIIKNFLIKNCCDTFYIQAAPSQIFEKKTFYKGIFVLNTELKPLFPDYVEYSTTLFASIDEACEALVNFSINFINTIYSKVANKPEEFYSFTNQLYKLQSDYINSK